MNSNSLLQKLWRQFQWGYGLVIIPISVVNFVNIMALYFQVPRGLEYIQFLALGGLIGAPGFILLGRFYRKYQLPTDTVYGNGPLVEEIRKMIREELDKA